MPQLEIQYQTKIHDDPEFCHNQSEQCRWFKGEYCSLTGAFLQMERGFRKKGKECKKIWYKINESRQPKTLAEGHRLG